jgi:dTDP-4-amino-4,6-dideoxygalactose transaminase
MAQPPVPLFDISLSDREIAAAEAALRSGWLTMGPRTESFEAAFAASIGARHAIAVSSCTAALHLAYLAAGVGPGDEVIVPTITFVATANAVRYCGATPVFADVVGQHDLGIDREHVEALITPRTRAVAAVHYAGYAADVEALADICDRRGIALVEDAAHSPSARPAESTRMLGTWGLAGCFSFFSNKVLGSGEGGLLATDDDEVAGLARSLRSQGITSNSWQRFSGATGDYDAVGLGFNYRLDELRAALLLSRLKRLDQDIARRRELTRAYREKLGEIDGLSLPYADADVERSTCYVMPVIVDDEERRDAVRRHLRERHGVQTSLLYPAVHEFTAYRERFGVPPLPRAEHIARAEITIPLFPEMGEETQDRVVAALAEALA